MEQNIQDGVYPAHLSAATVKLNGKGLPMLVLQWQLDGLDATIRSYVHFTLSDGSPNVKGIGHMRKWATDWDGIDLYWFNEHFDVASRYPVRLTIVNGPLWNDPTRICAQVKWVNPAKWTQPNRTEQATPQEEHPSAATDAELQQTMCDTWRMWCDMTRACSVAYRQRIWVAHARETVPGKDQVDFTPGDWRRMQLRLRLLGAKADDNI